MRRQRLSLQVVDRGGQCSLSAEDGVAGFGDYDAYYREYDDDEEVLSLPLPFSAPFPSLF